MLSEFSFEQLQKLPVSEIFGTGSNTFEVIYTVNTVPSKVWINARDFKTAVNFFCKRFGLGEATTEAHSIVAMKLRFWRIYARDALTNARKYDDAIIRRIRR